MGRGGRSNRTWVVEKGPKYFDLFFERELERSLEGPL
jgi:hypothetical protein